MTFEIKVAKNSSFCPGVDRAFRITEKTLFGHRGRAVSAGPLIHNPEVVSRLGMLGLETIDPDARDLPDLEGVPVIIRSHGIDVETERRLAEKGAVLVDATCPTVKLAQDAARRFADAGYVVVVLGSAGHPEVRSIVGRASSPVVVFESISDARRWLEEEWAGEEKVGIVCQTTIRRSFLRDVVKVMERVVPHVEVRDTVCKSVSTRRDEAMELARGVDLMLVVGGHNSSNTRQLALACAETGTPTYQIEEPDEIEPEWLEGAASVGVTGGASTPDWQINETVSYLRGSGT